jgi:fructose-1,6-bisphosphatase/inositol monophosphatase family enzyme
MVAETRAGEVVRSWIWQPEHGVAWVAERGEGTWRNGEKVCTTPVPDSRAPQGVTSMWALRDSSLGDLPPMRLSWVCCGVDYPKLIEGAADYLLYSRSNPWDHAPGSLLVAEAGGAMGHPDGTPYTPRSLAPGLVVAADRHTFSAVQRRAHEAFASR